MTFAADPSRKYARVNRLRRVKIVRGDDPVIRTLSVSEFNRLLDAAPSERWRVLLKLLYWTGCRREEIQGLTWDRVDFDDRGIKVINTKTGKDRVVPLNGSAVAELRRWRESCRWRIGKAHVLPNEHGGRWEHNVNRDFGKIVAKAGIAYCTPHDLRRTAVTNMLRGGMSPKVVQRVVGHASFATTMRYYHSVSDEDKRLAVDATDNLGQNKAVG